MALSKQKKYCTKTKNLKLWLYIILTPLFVLSFISAIPNLHFMPTLQISECYSQKQNGKTFNYFKLMNRSMFSTVLAQFIHNVMFFTAIFAIRHIEDQFNISKELRRVCGISTVLFWIYTALLLFFPDSVFVSLGLA